MLRVFALSTIGWPVVDAKCKLNFVTVEKGHAVDRIVGALKQDMPIGK